MSNLIVVCEGGASFLEYLLANGVHPTDAVFDITNLQSMLPYLSKDDELLVVIHGLTDFTMSSVHTLMDTLKQYEDSYGSLTVLSDVPLSLTSGYFMYEGDLFCGRVWYHGADKKDYFVEDGKPTETLYAKAAQKQLALQEVRGNSVLRYFQKYNNPKVKITLHGEDRLRAPFTGFTAQEDVDRDRVVVFDDMMPKSFVAPTDFGVK